jgi:hypothetical protein
MPTCPPQGGEFLDSYIGFVAAGYSVKVSADGEISSSCLT